MVVTDDGSDELTAAATPAAWRLTDVVSATPPRVSPPPPRIVDAAAGMTGAERWSGTSSHRTRTRAKMAFEAA